MLSEFAYSIFEIAWPFLILNLGLWILRKVFQFYDEDINDVSYERRGYKLSLGEKVRIIISAIGGISIVFMGLVALISLFARIA